MSRRSQTQQVHHHQFAVIIPAGRQEADFSGPAMRQQRSVFREPGPIDAAEETGCKFYYFRMAKVLAAGKDSAQQNGRVNGRNFGIPNSFPGVEVSKVVEESAMIRQLLPKEAKRGENAFQGIAGGNQ